MSPSLSLSSAVAVLPFPNCQETINTSMQECPFCSASIDRDAAQISAAATSRISQACSDASYLKIMLGILIPFGATIFFPFLGLLGLVGFVFIKYALPVMILRWWAKYGRVKTTDTDFRTARGTVIWVSAVSFLVLLLVRVNLFGLRLW
jgi:hypothetical protein